MKNKGQFLKSMFMVGSLLVVAALLLTGCDGTLSFQGSAVQNEDGGVDVTGGVQPDTTGAQPETAPQSSGGTSMDQTTIILIGVGIAFFILILVMLVTRGQSKGEPRE